MDQPKPGKLYKHYKGDTYKIVTLAKHSETSEWMVVYERMTDIVHDGYKIHVRPLDMFLETVEVNGKKLPRFELIG
jgi:cyclomaltodextrinase